jgi:hypothetical protein
MRNLLLSESALVLAHKHYMTDDYSPLLHHAVEDHLDAVRWAPASEFTVAHSSDIGAVPDLRSDFAWSKL